MRPYLPALLSGNNMERNEVVDWAASIKSRRIRAA